MAKPKSRTQSARSSALLLKKELRKLLECPSDSFSVGLTDDDDIYCWEVAILGPSETFYEGGVFKAQIAFPKDYPHNPPIMKFISKIWHPNVYVDGLVCISILHQPGNDNFGSENPDERWSPAQSVESIMLSVISMLSEPNCDSPANVEAAIMFEKNLEKYKSIVLSCVEKSLVDDE